jgi:L-asparaginase II|tara:strand:- start:10 stop:402 length:393 start_codon:yes stop_codon:yes gene_type:complete
MTIYLTIAGIASLAILIITSTSYRLFKLNKTQAAKIADLQNQLSALCAGAVGADNRIVKFEQVLNQLKEHQNTLDLGMSSQHNYDHAIRLARKGAGMNQLIDNCNLSDEEAHLINRLHGSNNSAFKQEFH